jgi:hypothetical protein
MEASWNWSKIYEGPEGLEEVARAIPLGTRLIADALDQTRQGGRGGLRDAVAGQFW